MKVPMACSARSLRFSLLAASIALASAAQISNRDRAMIQSARDANPPGYSFTIEGPASVAYSEPLLISAQYSQPEPIPERGPIRMADFSMSGFILRGPVSCGFPDLTCPTPEMLSEPSVHAAYLRMARHFPGTQLDLRKLLPDLPPGDYTLYGVMIRMQWEFRGSEIADRRHGKIPILGKPASPPSYLISEPYRFRIEPEI